MPPSTGAADRAAMFTHGYSIEATRPTPAEIAAVAALTGRQRLLYLSAVPTQSLRELAGTAAQVRGAGLEPVVHLAARRIGSERELADFLAALHDQAGARRLLVIGGDVDHAGPYADALAIIRRGRLRENGIEDIGIAGYPEAHPRIPAAALSAALSAKVAAAADNGLRLHIVSQFAFAPEPIIGWLRQLRAGGIDVPVRVGMAGPTSMAALLRYAKRCGVNASMRGLATGAAASLIGHVGPERIIEGLIGADAGLGDIAPHYFSFGGVERTARYACEIAARRPLGDRAMSHAK